MNIIQLGAPFVGAPFPWQDAEKNDLFQIDLTK
jgi:hypothetical protein